MNSTCLVEFALRASILNISPDLRPRFGGAFFGPRSKPLRILRQPPDASVFANALRIMANQIIWRARLRRRTVLRLTH